MAEYNYKEIEKKWQKYWEDNKTFKCDVDASKPKHYVLDMFPYPSGDGLHIGHAENYTISDIIARHKRMLGYNVLHPMGWDAFGLPAERFAERTGIHPAEVVSKNTAVFRAQMKESGFSYDWDREINTTDPDYYKWTQWIFKILFDRGLAYEVTIPVNWCPKQRTVLANEEVKDGKYVDTGDEVVKKPMRQWMLKITAYAERLLQDLDTVDWPESIKTMQREWIGKSTGADVTFKIDGMNAEFTVYTTRPDTLFGATYCVLAPEHSLVEKITTPAQKSAVYSYIAETCKKSAQDRMQDLKEKTGAFTGAYAINPVNGVKIPIYIADYVLGDYGYGAIMAVPAHDGRDYDFAKKFDIPIIQVIEGGDISVQAHEGDGKLINSGFLDGLYVKDSKEKMSTWLEEQGFGKKTVNYKLRDWLFARQRYWGEPFPIIHLQDGTIKSLPLKDLPVLLPEMAEFKPTEDGEPPLARVEEWVNTTDPETSKPARRETNTMPQWAGSCWYFLRFCDPKNDTAAWSKESEKYWMPVDTYIGGVEHAVLHLLYARFWQKVLFDAGYVTHNEPFKRLINQGMIQAYSYRDANGKYYYPKDVEKRDNEYYVKGSDTKLETQVEKMSKSRYNVVNPTAVIEEHGADAMRLYLMFMGPIDADKPWTDEGITGLDRFLKRVWNIFETKQIVETGGDAELTRLIHKTIKGITEDMERLTYNTAISKLMEYVNAVYKSEKPVNKKDMENFLLLLAAQAPHICEELWQRLGHTETIAYQPWPTYDPTMTQSDTVDLVVQVMGKKRAMISISKTMSKEDIIAAAKAEANVASFLDGKEIVKEIYVPGRLLNFVVK
ncbi:MAG: leucine--tRNA ligase [Lactobacillales bacterium]|jgi:leucyl-tRNA synthetase|nr:leucine--tRNA ligase [Lactobacillales bacterium]